MILHDFSPFGGLFPVKINRHVPFHPQQFRKYPSYGVLSAITTFPVVAGFAYLVWMALKSPDVVWDHHHKLEPWNDKRRQSKLLGSEPHECPAPEY